MNEYEFGLCDNMNSCQATVSILTLYNTVLLDHVLQNSSISCLQYDQVLSEVTG